MSNINKEFNWKQHKSDIVRKYINKYKSLDEAIVILDARIASLEIDCEMKDEIISDFQKVCEHKNTYYQPKESFLT